MQINNTLQENQNHEYFDSLMSINFLGDSDRTADSASCKINRKIVLSFCRFGLLGSIDANTGSPDLGWDTDQFPMDVKNAALMMKVKGVMGVMGRAQLRSIPTKSKLMATSHGSVLLSVHACMYACVHGCMCVCMHGVCLYMCLCLRVHLYHYGVLSLLIIGRQHCGARLTELLGR